MTLEIRLQTFATMKVLAEQDGHMIALWWSYELVHHTCTMEMLHLMQCAEVGPAYGIVSAVCNTIIIANAPAVATALSIATAERRTSGLQVCQGRHLQLTLCNGQ